MSRLPPQAISIPNAMPEAARLRKALEEMKAYNPALHINASKNFADGFVAGINEAREAIGEMLDAALAGKDVPG